MKHTPRTSTALVAGTVVLAAASGAWAQPRAISDAETLPPAEPYYDVEEPHGASGGPEQTGWPTAAAAAPAGYVLAAPEAPDVITDPARHRTGVFNSAQVLQPGEVAFGCRGLFVTDLAVGLTDRLEFDLANTPLLVLGKEGWKNALWSAGLRFLAYESEVTTLTLDVHGVGIGGWAGIRAGALLRFALGPVTLHAGASAHRMWDAFEGWMTAGYDCRAACGGEDSVAGLLATGAVDWKVHHKVKLIVESGYETHLDMLLVNPMVRLHGHHFAVDLGVITFYATEDRQGVLLPLVNMSVTY
jgi:hypothetical protein